MRIRSLKFVLMAMCGALPVGTGKALAVDATAEAVQLKSSYSISDRALKAPGSSTENRDAAPASEAPVSAQSPAIAPEMAGLARTMSVRPVAAAAGGVRPLVARPMPVEDSALGRHTRFSYVLDNPRPRVPQPPTGASVPESPEPLKPAAASLGSVSRAISAFSLSIDQAPGREGSEKGEALPKASGVPPAPPASSIAAPAPAPSRAVARSAFSIEADTVKTVEKPRPSVAAPGYAIEDLLQMALNSYPTVLSRRATKESAESDLLAAKLKFLPTPTVSTQQTQVQNGQGTAIRPATTFGITQPLFTGGALSAGYEKAEARLSSAELGILETREEVSKRLINAYVEWVRAYRKITALEESVRLHEGFAGLIKRRFGAGVASGADRDLGLSRLDQVRADLESQRSMESTLLSSISELVGESISRENLAARVAKPRVLPDRQEGIARSLAASPTLRRYKFDIDAADAEARELKAQSMPQVLLQAQRQMGNTLVANAQNYDTVGVVLQYAPGAGFSSFASANAAFDRVRAMNMQAEAARRDLTDKLNSEYNELEFSRLKQESLQRSVELSAEISGSYDRQYLLGRKSWLDLMTAVREVAQTRLSLADAEASALGASWRIAISVGGTEAFEIAANDR